MMRLFGIAKPLLDRGFRVVALGPNSKAPYPRFAPHGVKSFTQDPAVVAGWDLDQPNLNCGVVAHPDELWILDVDDPDIVADYLRETRQLSMPDTYTVMSARAPHYYFLPNAKSRAMGNIVIPGKCEARTHDMYVVAAGSMHPSGVQYKVVNDYDIAEAPDSLIEFLIRQGSASSPKKGQPGVANPSSVKDCFTWLKEWISRYDVVPLGPGQMTEQGGIKVYVDCPQKSLHTGDSGPSQSAILITPDGVYAYRCLHSHCADFLWKDFRTHHEPAFSPDQLHSFTQEAPPPDNVTATERTDPCDFPREALYGYLGELAPKLRVPLGLGYPALIACFSPLVPPTLDVRTNHYLGLIAPPHGAKGQVFERAREALHALPFRANLASDRGVEQAIKPAAGGPILIYQDEGRAPLKKMKIENSALSDHLNTLWSSDTIGTSVKAGVVEVSARMSLVINIPAGSPSEFRRMMPADTTKGLYDRFIWGKLDQRERSRYSRLSNLHLDELPAVTGVCVQVPDHYFDRMNQWIDRKAEEFPQLGFQSRLGEIVIRVAVTLASANGETELSEGAFLAATAFCDWQYQIRLLYSPAKGDDPLYHIGAAIIEQLTSLAGRATKRLQLQRMVRDDLGCSATSYKREFDSLVSTGEILWNKDRKEDIVWLPL